MNMRMVVAAVAAVALVAGAFAQGAGPAGAPGRGGQRGPGGPGGRRGGLMKMDEEVLAKLNLNAGQKAKIKTLKTKLQSDMKAAFEKSKGDRQAMRTAFQGVGKNYRDGLSKILTKPQLKQYQAAMKAKMEEFRKTHPGGPGGRGPGGPGKPPRA